MNFIEDNWQYINSAASARSVEIARRTGRWQDIKCFKQDIFLYLIKRIPKYDPNRAKPNTFIAMVTKSAKIQILRHIHRQKNQVFFGSPILVDASLLLAPGNPSSDSIDISEYIASLPEPESSICHALIIEEKNPYRLARRHGIKYDELIQSVRKAMQPLAELFGIKDVTTKRNGIDQNFRSDDKVTDDLAPRQAGGQA